MHTFRSARRDRPAGISLVIGFALLGILLAGGCAPRQRSRTAGPSASAQAPAAPHCPDRVDRAKTGGFVGGLFGTAVATIVGSPLLGGLYQVAGYAMGFASADSCPRAGASAVPSVNSLIAPQQTIVNRQSPHTESPGQKRPASVLVFREIKEENLPPSTRP